MVSIEDVIDHIKRAFKWRIADVIPHKEEAEKLTGEGIHNETIRSFLVWRRSLLFLAIPATLVNCILGLVGLLNLSEFLKGASVTMLGYGLSVLIYLASPILFGSVVYSLIKWTNYKQSMKVLRYGWIISVVFPLIQTLFPFEYIIEQDVIDELDKLDIAGIKMIMALAAALTLLPVLITFPGGLVQATLRVRSLYPHSSLAGWILMFSAPFQSFIVCVALVMIVQVAGNMLLLLGIVVLCSAPWCFLFRLKLFVGESTPDTEKQLDSTTRVKSIVTISGLLLLLLWGLTADVSGIKPIGSGEEIDNDGDGVSDVMYLKTYTGLVLFIFEYISRSMTTTIMFTDIITLVTFWNSAIDKKRRDSGVTEEMDKANASQREFFGKMGFLGQTFDEV